MRHDVAVLCCSIAVSTLVGCSRGARARATAPPPARIGHTETGLASWYGVPYHGRRTASGEVYDMEKLTAAHKKLPFETWVQVTNLRTGKQVEVRINDRGPFVRGRIVDLSRGAAREVDMLASGVDRVRLKVIPPPPSARTQLYSVQAGVFLDRSRAEDLLAKLARADARITGPDAERGAWHVLIGDALPQRDAEALVQHIRSTGQDAIAVRTPR